MLANFAANHAFNLASSENLSYYAYQSDLFHSLHANVLILGWKSNSPQFEENTGLVFNPGYSFVQAISAFDSEIIDSLNCLLQTSYNVDSLFYEHRQISLQPEIRTQLTPGSYLFDPVTSQSWLIDSTNSNGLNLDSCFLPTGSQHLIFHLKLDLLKSIVVEQANTPTSALESESLRGMGISAELNWRNEEIFFHPNPASLEICAIGIHEKCSPMFSCLLYDRNGRVVGVWKSIENCLPTDHLETGMYFLKCSDGTTQKIAIE
jgi:hypothetical protein